MMQQLLVAAYLSALAAIFDPFGGVPPICC